MLISVIVPCFNEQEALPVFYEEITKIAKQMNKYDFEFLFVDDGSRDNTLSLLKELSARDGRVKYFSFARNFGKESAMYAGFCNSKGDYTAVMDADMQDPPEFLPEMVKLLEGGEYDCVAARRETRDGEPPVRSFFARLFYKIINRISDINIMDGARDFRVMKRDMAEAIVEMGEYNRFSKGIFSWVGFRTCWLPYKNVQRVAGKTKWNFWNLFKYSVDGFINFSQAPLAAASWIGVILTLLTFIMFFAVVIRRLIFGDPVAGWASLACIIMFFSGVQLFCIGIVGQYIAKMYLESKHRPHYIIAQSNIDDVTKIR